MNGLPLLFLLIPSALPASCMSGSSTDGKASWVNSLSEEEMMLVGQGEHYLRENGILMTFAISCPSVGSDNNAPTVTFINCRENMIGREYRVFFDKTTLLPTSYEEVGAPKL